VFFQENIVILNEPTTLEHSRCAQTIQKPRKPLTRKGWVRKSSNKGDFCWRCDIDAIDVANFRIFFQSFA